MVGRLTHFQESRRLCMSSVQTSTMVADCCSVAVTVHNLPDIALLDIFGFYHDGEDVDEWHTLVHVCPRWRGLVFESPRRLNLRLLCTRRRPVRALLDIWSALPIAIEDEHMEIWEEGLDNIIAALEHPDRVCSIDLTEFSSLVWEELAEAMLVPFPELTHLVLTHMVLSPDHEPVLPDSFLGGSAPRLQTLKLCHISFRALPNLLLSASDLVHLSFTHLSHLEFISPESMVACLSSLNRLQTLSLGFHTHYWEFPSQSPRYRPSPQTRAVLPALTDLTFKGTCDYSEDFLSRIDAPILNRFSMSFSLGRVFHALDFLHFKRFIDHANGLKPPKVARVWFNPWSTSVFELSQQHEILETRCHRIAWQVDSIALVCDPPPFYSSIERFDLIAFQSPSETGEDDMASTQFLELFRRFTAIQSLRVSECIVPLVATALLDVIGERATEALPNLRDLFLGGSGIPETVPQANEAMQQFVTARQLSGQPVAVHHWGSEEFE
jgi:hypothetical protein